MAKLIDPLMVEFDRFRESLEKIGYQLWTPIADPYSTEDRWNLTVTESNSSLPPEGVIIGRHYWVSHPDLHRRANPILGRSVGWDPVRPHDVIFFVINFDRHPLLSDPLVSVPQDLIAEMATDEEIEESTQS